MYLLEYIFYDSILWARKLKLKFNDEPEVTQLVSRRAEVETQKYDSRSTCWTTVPTEAVTVGDYWASWRQCSVFQVARCAESPQVSSSGTQR